jgi:hypothetical protein
VATRARIGISTPEGVESIYVHWDGYPEGVGQTLIDHWTTSDKVRQLLDLGDVSELAPTVEETIFYIRDRGETRAVAKSHSLEEWPDYGQEFEYIGVLKEDGEVIWEYRPFGTKTWSR